MLPTRPSLFLSSQSEGRIFTVVQTWVAKGRICCIDKTVIFRRRRNICDPNEEKNWLTKLLNKIFGFVDVLRRPRGGENKMLSNIKH